MGSKETAKKRFEATVKDMSGFISGRLTVIRFSHKNKFNNRVWECLCKCGKTTFISTNSLNSANVQSCGCLTKESSTKHGFIKHPLYIVWRGLIRRCYVENNKDYPAYGGAGIKISEIWLDRPSLFFEWSLKNGWQRGLHLDRFPDKKGNYSPENCRYVTCKVNQNNKVNTIIITHLGMSKTISEWGEYLKIPRSAIWQRHKKGSFTTEEILSTHNLQNNRKWKQ